MGLLAAFFPFNGAAPAAVVVMAAWVAYAVSAFKGGLWLDMAEPLAAMGLALFSGTAYQYFVEGREKREVKRLFGRYRVEGRLHRADCASRPRRAGR